MILSLNMGLTAILVSAGALLSALAGGLLALRATSSVGMIIAVGAGIRIGAAYFDLIPESVTQLGSLDLAMAFTAAGFLLFYAIEKMTTPHIGIVGAAGMSLHSFLDGVALAAALAVGGGIGLVIGAVVIVHRFSDGIGIFSLLLASQQPLSVAYRWLAVVAGAPVFGVILGLALPIPDEVLGGMLAVFAGFFLYIGAATLLPEAHRSDRSRWIVVGTLVGVVAVYGFSVVAGAVGASV